MSCLFTIGASAAVTVSITAPQSNKIEGDSVQVSASVSSSFEITNVVASVSGLQTNLSVVGPNAFSGVMGLNGLSRGPKSVVVSATDAFGNTGSSQINFMLDRPPTIAVLQPEIGLVVRRWIPIKVACSDDGTNCTVMAQVYPNNFGNSPFFTAEGTNSIQTVVDGSYHNPRTTLVVSTAIVSINAADSSGQTVATNAVAFVEPNPRLIEETRVRGHLWDFDSNRLLFLDWASGTVRIRDRATGVDSILATAALPFPWDCCSPSGFLTAHGAILGIQSVRGAYGASISNGVITVVDLNSGNEVTTVTGADTLGDLAPSGAVAYTKAGGSICLSSWPQPLGQGDLYPNPKTDGTNVIYLVSSNGVANGQNVTFRWLMHFDGVTVSQLTPAAANANLSFAVDEGWLAFTKPGPSGVPQVWRRPPGGSAIQLTFFGTSSSVRWLRANGHLIYTHDGNDYLVNPGGETVLLGPNGYWGNQDFYFSDGKLHRIIGGTLFELSTAPTFARLVDTARTNAGFRFTVVGDVGVTSVVQRAASPSLWENRKTNVLDSLGFDVSEPLMEPFRLYRVKFP